MANLFNSNSFYTKDKCKCLKCTKYIKYRKRNIRSNYLTYTVNVSTLNKCDNNCSCKSPEIIKFPFKATDEDGNKLSSIKFLVDDTCSNNKHNKVEHHDMKPISALRFLFMGTENLKSSIKSIKFIVEQCDVNKNSRGHLDIIDLSNNSKRIIKKRWLSKHPKILTALNIYNIPRKESIFELRLWHTGFGASAINSMTIEY